MLELTEQEMLLSDRRDALRQKARVGSVLVEHPVTGTVEAMMLDTSRRGMRLLMPKCVPCGEEIIVHPPSGTDLLRLRAQIIRQRVVKQGDEQWFECGIQVSDSAEWRRHKWFLALRDPAAA